MAVAVFEPITQERLKRLVEDLEEQLREPAASAAAGQNDAV